MTFRYYFYACILTLFTLNLHAQSNKAQTVRWPAKASDVQQVKNRILLVALPGVPSIDNNLKRIISEYWDFSKTEFAPAKSIPSLLKGNEQKYAVMSVDMVEIKQSGFIIGGLSSSYIRFSVRLGEKYDKKKSIYYQDVYFTRQGENIALNPREIFVGIYNIMNHYNSRLNNEGIIEAMYKNAGKLEQRTLLIDKEFLHTDMTPEKISALYPFPYKIVSAKDIEKALTEKNEKYAFVELVPAGTATNMLTHDIYDCRDGQLLSSGELNNGAFDSYSNLINEDHLKAYVRNYERLNKLSEERK